jgi:lipoprotein-releasing system permease protein
MTLRVALPIALRYLTFRRGEGFISVIAGFSCLGICLGVATLIIVMSVMNGFRQELTGKILDFNSHISLSSPHNNLHEPETLLQKINPLENIKFAMPVVEGQAMLSFKGKSLGVMVRGVRTQDMQNHPSLSDKVVMGSFSQFSDNPDVISVGSKLFYHLNLSPGDSITLIIPDGNITPFGKVPRLKTFHVQVVFETGMYDFDRNFVFIPFETAQRFFNMGDRFSHMELFLKDPHKAPQMLETLHTVLDMPWSAITWQNAHASFFEAIKIERNVMFIILTLIIIIAAFNIISGLVMLVKDKTRDIAILRTMGASKGVIMAIFFSAGSLIGIVGTVGGLGLGLLFCTYIEPIRQFLQYITGATLFNPELYFLSQLPVRIEFAEVFTVVGMSLCISFLATLYPAWRAAKLNPVEALRYE